MNTSTSFVLATLILLGAIAAVHAEPGDSAAAAAAPVCTVPVLAEADPGLGSAIDSPLSRMSDFHRPQDVAEMKALLAEDDESGLALMWLALMGCAGMFGYILRAASR